MENQGDFRERDARYYMPAFSREIMIVRGRVPGSGTLKGENTSTAWLGSRFAARVTATLM